jgi:hypothetical protein
MKIKLELDPKELDLIAQTLAQRPWVEVQALMVTLQKQVQEQQNAGIPNPGVAEPR